jgi:ribosomal protein S18 acetylase RimI-like enzyme
MLRVSKHSDAFFSSLLSPWCCNMISVDAITPRNAMVFKEIRLRALEDAPSAFSSTCAKEAQLSDADWIERAAQWSGQQSVAYLALDKANACGIAGAFLDHDDVTRAHLVSMWVAPGHRRLGVGATLVNAIVEWARTQSVGELELLVTSNNDGAIKFYQSLGFVLTGITTPHVNDLTLSDCEMIRTIG